MSLDLTKTLEELESTDWGQPSFPSHIVTECHRIRKKRLIDLTNEELRLAILQRMGLAYLLPIAIVRLEDNPLAKGDYFPGDFNGKRSASSCGGLERAIRINRGDANCPRQIVHAHAPTR